MRAERTDAEVRTTLLRAPAAVVIGAFAIGLMFGVFASANPADAFSLTGYWLALFICVPFLLPSTWFRHGSSGLLLRNWLVAAAIVATVRLALRSAWFFSHRPFANWLMMALLDATVAASLWLAAFALLRRIRAS